MRHRNRIPFFLLSFCASSFHGESCQSAVTPKSYFYIYGVGNAIPARQLDIAIFEHATNASCGPNHHIVGMHKAISAATQAAYVAGPAAAPASIKNIMSMRIMILRTGFCTLLGSKLW